MGKDNTVQLSMLIDNYNRESVLNEVRRIFSFSYDLKYFFQVENTFTNICVLFDGSFPGYKKCNTEYHNIVHTTDAFLATSRLMDGRAATKDRFDEKLAVNLLIAALMHDTGYIQEDGDNDGTGAKYTSIHEERSVSFLEKNADTFHINADDVKQIASLILCTEIKNDRLRLLKGEERDAGAILGTADLLCQMSDRAYLEKLLFLYYEFREANIGGLNTTFDILKNTLSFYESTLERFEKILAGSYGYALHFFRLRYNINENLYITAIENQINYLRRIIDDETGNFRNKLKRLDIEKMELQYTISKEYL